MPQKVTLSKEGQTATVIVESAHLTDSHIRLTGFDPSFCPDGMEEGMQFLSKDLTAIIEADSPVSVESVAPTDEAVPEPDVSF